jgi:hypothetical protein
MEKIMLDPAHDEMRRKALLDFLLRYCNAPVRRRIERPQQKCAARTG